MTKTFFGRWNNLCFYFSKDISGRSFQELFLNNYQNDVKTIMLYANYVMSKSLLLNGQRIVMLMIHYNLAYENLMYMEGISHLVIVLIPNFFALCLSNSNMIFRYTRFLSMPKNSIHPDQCIFYIEFLGPIKSFVVPIRCHKIIVNDLSEDPARPF